MKAEAGSSGLRLGLRGLGVGGTLTALWVCGAYTTQMMLVLVDRVHRLGSEQLVLWESE